MMQQDSISIASPSVSAETPASEPSVHSATKEVRPQPAPRRQVIGPAPGAADTVSADSTATAQGADSVSADTIHHASRFGILLTPPGHPEADVRDTDTTGMSVILSWMLLLFCVVGIRFHNNRKYVTSLMRNLVEVRVRQNVFDETVRETSFLVLLNLLWSCSAGIILCRILDYTVGTILPEYSLGIKALTESPATCMGICMGVGVAYTCFMTAAFYVVGSVFTDSAHAAMWVKGYMASQGLLSFFYFPLSLVFLFYPQWTEVLIWVAGVAFVIAKVIFIWKGFRIFFTQSSSWVLFLYYLCSLEIVPLILTYLAAIALCGLVS